MDRKKVFNDLVEVPQNENKHNCGRRMQRTSRSERSCYFRECCRGEEEGMETINLTQGRENIAKFFTFPETKATITKAASAPTETSANITEVDLTSTTELEVPSEDAACLPVPEVL